MAAFSRDHKQQPSSGKTIRTLSLVSFIYLGTVLQKAAPWPDLSVHTHSFTLYALRSDLRKALAMRRKAKGTDLRNQTFKSDAHKVCMSPKKRKAKLLQLAEFHAEALRLAGNLSANQQRFIEVAIARGKELEPSGWLAGGRN